MSSLLYIHGFLSSPASAKAVITGDWLSRNRPPYRFICPFLTPYPDKTQFVLESMVKDCLGKENETLYLMGSSLGGFWSTWLAEKYKLKAVLINPVVDLRLFKTEMIGRPLKNYHTDDIYTLTELDVEHFRSLHLDEIKYPENYLVLLQTGDEVLDYRLAAERYSRSRMIIEEGGDHGFTNLESRLPEAMAFLENSL